jgi:hypothetical protein
MIEHGTSSVASCRQDTPTSLVYEQGGLTDTGIRILRGNVSRLIRRLSLTVERSLQRSAQPRIDTSEQLHGGRMVSTYGALAQSDTTDRVSRPDGRMNRVGCDDIRLVGQRRHREKRFRIVEPRLRISHRARSPLARRARGHVAAFHSAEVDLVSATPSARTAAMSGFLPRTSAENVARLCSTN